MQRLMSSVLQRIAGSNFRHDAVVQQSLDREVSQALLAERDCVLLRARQQERLKSIIETASQSVEYYRHRWSKLGINTNSIGSVADLSTLPIIEKELITRQLDAFLNRSFPESTIFFSSGSTGPVHSTVVERRALLLGGAAFVRALHAANAIGRVHVANVVPWSSTARTQHFRSNRMITWTDIGLPEFVENQYQSDDAWQRVVLAPPLVLSEIVARLGEQYQDSNVVLMNSYERLDSYTRALVSRMTDRFPFDLYTASSVSAPIAFECDEHSGLHINDDYVVVEIVDNDGNSVGPGQPGHVLVTDLLNHAMPLIRFRTGDVASFSDARCHCGRCLPRLMSMEGRVDDYITLSDGHRIAASEVTDALGRIMLGDFCLVQEAIGQFTLLTEGNPSLDEVRSCLASCFGESYSLSLADLDGRPATRTGKRPKFYSRLPREIHLPTT